MRMSMHKALPSLSGNDMHMGHYGSFDDTEQSPLSLMTSKSATLNAQAT